MKESGGKEYGLPFLFLFTFCQEDCRPTHIQKIICNKVFLPPSYTKEIVIIRRPMDHKYDGLVQSYLNRLIMQQSIVKV